MGLKILHSADWHMGTPFASFSPERKEFLLRQQMRIPEKIADICCREHCDLVLLAGDIFDGIPSRDVIDAVKQALADCGVPVFVSPGNHDFLCPGSPWLEEVWPENVTVFSGGMEEHYLPELHCRIYGAGYSSMDCGPLLAHFRATGAEEYRIGLLHGDPVTPNSPYCPVTAAQVRDSGLHYLALGHIHMAGQFSAGNTLCAWPGCPMGRGWDETGEKGLCIVNLEQEAAAAFWPLDVPRFYDLEVDVTCGMEAAVSMLPAAGSDDFYRITLTGESSAVTLLDLEGYPNLILRDRTRPKQDLWEDAGSDTFRGIYFGLLQTKAKTDPKAALAAEISRKILQGREVKLP